MSVPSFIKPRESVVAPAQLTVIADKCKEAQLLEADIEKTEAILSAMKAKLYLLLSETLPDRMDEVGITKLEFRDPNSNIEYEVKATNFYHAAISSNWDPNRRALAFSYLDQIKEGDLIKTDLVISFPRDKRKKASTLYANLLKKSQKAGYEISINESVHHATLTAWLKNSVEKKNFLPDLEKIGAVVGRKVKIKEK